MNDMTQALADARDALAIYRRYGPPHYGEPLCGYATNAIDALDDLLAAQAPPAAVAAVPEGMVMVQRADLAALEATDFGRCGWSVRADLAALRLRDGLLAAAERVEVGP